jgi:predicted metal-dependent enzyme (double-stranded beta helix superfamily)
MSLAEVLQPPAAPAPQRAPLADRPIDLSADLALQWACTPALWAPLVHHVEDERWYAPLFANDQANGWIITWAPGTALGLHDHGRAAGTVAVLEGALTEQYTSRRPARRPRRVGPLTTRTLRAGSVTSFGRDHIHRLRNEGRRPVVSLHVYTPTLDEMTFYAAPEATEARAVDARLHRAEPSTRLAEIAASVGTAIGGMF